MIKILKTTLLMLVIIVAMVFMVLFPDVSIVLVGAIGGTSLGVALWFVCYNIVDSFWPDKKKYDKERSVC